MHWLPNRRAASCTNCGFFTAAELIETLSRAGQQQLADVLERANAAAHGERHENLLGRAADDVEHDVAAFVAGRNVEKHELVGAFLLVPRGHLDRIARIAKVHEIRALHHASAVDIETGNHTLSEHFEAPSGSVLAGGLGRRSIDFGQGFSLGRALWAVNRRDTLQIVGFKITLSQVADGVDDYLVIANLEDSTVRRFAS